MFFAAAGQGMFSLSAPRKAIAADEVLQVSYHVERAESADDFKEPSFEGWQVVSGPYFNEQKGYINGVSTIKSSYTFLLAPRRTGTLLVPATSIMLDGRRVQSNSLSITVGRSSGKTASTGMLDEDAVLQPGENPAKVVKENVFMKVEVSKPQVFVGEPVLVSYKLYVALRGQSKVVRQPSFAGASVIEMTTDELPEYEVFNGRRYKAFLIRKVQLYPLEEGRLLLEPAIVENEFQYYVTNDIYPKTYKSELKNDTSSIRVLPLPAIVTGTKAVGDFDVKVSLKKTSFEVREKGIFTVEVSGQGNFQNIQPSYTAIKHPFEVFDEVEKTELDRLSFPVTGKKIIEVPFVVHEVGSYKLPAVEIRYFNPYTLKYMVKTTKELPVNIVAASPGKKQKVEHTITASDQTNYKYFWLVPALALVAGFIWAKSFRQKKKVVTVAAVMPVREERQQYYPNDVDFDVKLLNTSLPANVFVNKIKTAVERALQNWLRSKQHSFESMMQLLRENNPSLHAEVSSLMQEADHLLYSGIANDEHKQQLFTKAVAVIDQLKVLYKTG